MRREKLLGVARLPVILIVVSAALIWLPSRMFGPARSTASSVLLYPRRVAVGIIGWFQGGDSEADQLQTRLDVLERKVVELSNEVALKDRKIGQLSRLGQEPAARGWGFISADIIGTDASIWGGTVEIDAGSGQDVVVGSGVVANGAVFGTVVEVYRWSSRVRRVTDPGWSGSGMVAGTATRGVVRGNGRKGCTVEFVVTASLIPKGEKVVSSGTDGVFPRGMVIGTVTGCSWNKQGIVVDLELEAASVPGLGSSVVVLKPLK